MPTFMVKGFIKLTQNGRDFYLNISQITSLTPTEDGKTFIRTNDEFYKSFTADVTLVQVSNAILASQAYEGL